MIMEKLMVLVVVVLLCLSGMVIINKDLNVEATPEGGGGEDGGVGLDYTYIYNITEELSNVISLYPAGMIPKGRAFGTWGEHYTADKIINKTMNDIGLWNVTLEQIEDMPSGFEVGS